MAAIRIKTFPIAGAHGAPQYWTLDQGVDVTAAGGTALVAVESGTVTYRNVSGFTNGRATMPVLYGDSGTHYYYGHALHPACRQGQRVGVGQKIAVVGEGKVGLSTGPHLEFGLCNAFGVPLGRETAAAVRAALEAAPLGGPYALNTVPVDMPIGPVSPGGVPLPAEKNDGERKWDYSPAVHSTARAHQGHASVIEAAASNVTRKLARWRLPR